LRLGREPSGRFLVLDVVRLRGGPHDVEAAIVTTAHQDGRAVPIGLPQDPGQAGKHQVAWLAARLAGHRVVASAETGAKVTRALPVAAQAAPFLKSCATFRTDARTTRWTRCRAASRCWLTRRRRRGACNCRSCPAEAQNRCSRRSAD
jgi:hypothetical protein